MIQYIGLERRRRQTIQHTPLLTAKPGPQSFCLHHFPPSSQTKPAGQQGWCSRDRGCSQPGTSLQPPRTFTNNDHPTELAILLPEIIRRFLYVKNGFSFPFILSVDNIQSVLRTFRIVRNYLPTIGFSLLRAMVLNVIFQPCITIFKKKFRYVTLIMTFLMYIQAHMQWRCSGDAMILLNKNINLCTISTLQALNNWKSSSYIISHYFLCMSSM